MTVKAVPTVKTLKLGPTPEDVPDGTDVKREITAEIAGETFTLADDLTAMELLEAVAMSSGGPGSTRGVLDFLHRVIGLKGSAEWDLFNKVTARWEPKHFGQLAGDLIEAYSDFPTGAGPSAG